MEIPISGISNTTLQACKYKHTLAYHLQPANKWYKFPLFDILIVTINTIH